jgi:hypothetical protein
MGANPYFYFTPYQKNIQRALDELWEQEFRAGHYNPAMSMVDPPRYMFEMQFPPDAGWPSPGAKHGSIEEALDAGMEAGTGSILDLFRVTSTPDFFSACPLPDDDLVKLFGTAQPTRALVDSVLTRPGRVPRWKRSTCSGTGSSGVMGANRCLRRRGAERAVFRRPIRRLSQGPGHFTRSARPARPPRGCARSPRSWCRA